MSINKKYGKIPVLDKEEAEIITSLENGEWKSVGKKEFEKQKSLLTDAANNTVKKFKKNKSITIRINENILEKIKAKAMIIGIPYQTMISEAIYELSVYK
jgi:predicted DNA binding CopG/RHH family protein